MNRTIKFRAWNPQQKRMFYPGDGMTDVVILNYNKKTGDFTDFEVGEAYYDWDVLGIKSRVDGDCRLMQFTGVHDKNGKEAYHCDIFRYMGELFLLEWHEDWFSWWGKPINHNNGFASMMNANMQMEILGNIYDNPELLKPKQ